MRVVRVLGPGGKAHEGVLRGRKVRRVIHGGDQDEKTKKRRREGINDRNNELLALMDGGGWLAVEIQFGVSCPDLVGGSTFLLAETARG